MFWGKIISVFVCFREWIFLFVERLFCFVFDCYFPLDLVFIMIQSNFSNFRFFCVNVSLPLAVENCCFVSLDSGIYDIFSVFSELTEARPFDILLQEEVLGRRVLLQGLENLQCRSVFWAKDPHLNFYWQVFYARQFDLVCSTQERFAKLFRQNGVPQAAWLPWAGTNLPFKPWSERKNELAFVGRLAERPVRRNLCDFLQKRFGLLQAENMERSAMFSLYSQTKIVPNEAILGEVNMRLFEGASCGCVVVGQKTAEDTEFLFEPNKEVLFFENVLELENQIAKLLASPDEAKQIGYRAWRRIQAEHLPSHRGKKLLQLVALLEKNHRLSEVGRADFVLSLHALAQAGTPLLSSKNMLQLLLEFKDVDMQVRRALLQHLYAVKQYAKLDVELMETAQGDFVDFFLLQTCSVAALLGLNRFDLARFFWQKYSYLEKKRLRVLANPEELLLAWAEELRRRSQISRPGFFFDEKCHLPQTAVECVMCAISLTDEPTAVIERMQFLLRKEPGYDEFRLRHLSWLGLRRRQDWRLGLELALTNLRIFRKREGLEELFLALETARLQGCETEFFRLLRAMDLSGFAWKFLLAS